jgi:hypothetical protein
MYAVIIIIIIVVVVVVVVCLDNREYGRRDPSRWPRGTLYPHKLAINSPTSGSRSVGIVRSRNQTTEFFFIIIVGCWVFLHLGLYESNSV